MQLATRAVVTAVLAAAVAVAGYLGGLPLTIAAAVLAIVFALGWPSLAGLPFVAGSGPRGGSRRGVPRRPALRRRLGHRGGSRRGGCGRRGAPHRHPAVPALPARRLRGGH